MNFHDEFLGDSKIYEESTGNIWEVPRAVGISVQ